MPLCGGVSGSQQFFSVAEFLFLEFPSSMEFFPRSMSVEYDGLLTAAEHPGFACRTRYYSFLHLDERFAFCRNQ